MRGYIIKRLLLLIPVLFIVSMVVFSIIHITPGDPAAIMLGDGADEKSIQSLREQLGLNAPIYMQYLKWFSGTLVGNFGFSIFMKQPVMVAILDHIGPTVSLAILAENLAIVVAIPIGVMAAVRRGTAVDQGLMGLSLMGLSIPSFLLGLLLILLFSVQLRWLPVAGYAPKL